jgi:hypothetical protein
VGIFAIGRRVRSYQPGRTSTSGRTGSGAA